jgi:hypothetical protein
MCFLNKLNNYLHILTIKRGVNNMYQIIFYVPESHLEAVKSSMFAAGAGQLGNYAGCAWQVKGTGQFCPQAGSQPFLGQEGQIEHVVEFKVEMICKVDCIKEVIAALKSTHPYEEPAYAVIELKNLLIDLP